MDEKDRLHDENTELREKLDAMTKSRRQAHQLIFLALLLFPLGILLQHYQAGLPWNMAVPFDSLISITILTMGAIGIGTDTFKHRKDRCDENS